MERHQKSYQPRKLKNQTQNRQKIRHTDPARDFRRLQKYVKILDEQKQDYFTFKFAEEKTQNCLEKRKENHVLVLL